CDQVGAIGIHRERLRGDAFGLKDLLEVIDRERLVAGGGVDLNERAVALENLRTRLVPIDRTLSGTLCLQGGEGSRGDGGHEHACHRRLLSADLSFRGGRGAIPFRPWSWATRF